jgi:hypothetical protein
VRSIESKEHPSVDCQQEQAQNEDSSDQEFAGLATIYFFASWMLILLRSANTDGDC